MKKLILPITALLLVSSSISVFASDDLDDLDSLLNDPTLTEDTGSTTSDTNNQTGDNQTTDENSETNSQNQDQENNQTTEKLVLTQTGSVTSDSVTVEFKPLDNYYTYKVYYAPVGDNNFMEKDVTVEDTTKPVDVTISGLQPDTEYQFVVKAFDDDGNPIESTTSDSITVKTASVQHPAPTDNVIYNPVVKVQWNKINISWKAGADVDKVQISISEDGKTFKTIATVPGTQGKYTLDAKTTGKKYIKLVPIAKDGTLGVCKVGIAEVPYLTATVAPKKTAQKKIGHAKTGPETYLLFILAIIIALGFVYRKSKA